MRLRETPLQDDGEEQKQQQGQKQKQGKSIAWRTGSSDGGGEGSALPEAFSLIRQNTEILRYAQDDDGGICLLRFAVRLKHFYR